MTIKQKIDKYLKDNYGDVVFETKVKGFRWQPIADKIGKDINKDLVKDRWKVVKKKMEDFNNIEISKVIAGNKQQDLIEDYVKEHKTISFDVTDPQPKELNNIKKECKLITFFKNIIKKYR